MVWLKFYTKERERFPEAFNCVVSDEEAHAVVKKLKRHFKVPLLWVKFWSRKRQTGHAKELGVCLPHNPSIGVICHELAHIHNKHKYGNWRHDKKLMTTLAQFVRYCQKKNYWQQEPRRR